ncbi:hypothetical protein ABZ281_33445 [Streptomyces sp. NPDC006265]|uniref:hypothetical protein n=1 Tax=Streptomyces sp. NPDC006265 TaxID=3156740 RepID=UPI0033AF753D
MARFASRANKTALTSVNALAAVAVAFTLMVNLLRGLADALPGRDPVHRRRGLYARWTRAGRPTGIENVEADAEAA